MSGGLPRALSVALALDLAPADELATVPRDLWRSAEPSLDICLNFRCSLAKRRQFLEHPQLHLFLVVVSIVDAHGQP